MLTIKSVLPNFIKTVLFTAAATLSLNAFAGHHEEGEKKMKELKEHVSKKEQTLTADEKDALSKKSSLTSDEAIKKADATSDEMATKAEADTPKL